MSYRPRAAPAFLPTLSFTVRISASPSVRHRHCRRRRPCGPPVMTAGSTSPLRPAILLTNDDGLAPDHALVLPLAHRLVCAGHTVVVLAPAHDNSACGQRITIKRPMKLRRHPAEERKYGHASPSFARANGIPEGNLAVFTLDSGTPADCVIAAVEPEVGLCARLKVTPVLTVSGLNLGLNLGNDVLYSGTFAAARQAAMYGVPAVAASLDLFHVDLGDASHAKSVEAALDATEIVALAALRAVQLSSGDTGGRFARKEKGGMRELLGRGDVVLNLNVPDGWTREFETTRLDAILYKEAMSIDFVPAEGEEVEVVISGAKAVQMWGKATDSVAVLERGKASLTPVSTWPQPHPLAVRPESLTEDLGDGLPRWLEVTGKVTKVCGEKRKEG